MKRKIPIKKIIIIVSAFFLIGVARDLFIKAAISSIGSSVLGAQLKIRSFSSSLILQRVSIKGIVVGNPAGFDDSEALADIPEVTVRMNAFALIKGKFDFPLLILNMRQMTVIKNAHGQLNVEMLKIMREIQAESKAKQAKTEEERNKEIKLPPLKIDTLKLNIERIILKDYRTGTPPKVSVYDIGLKDKTMRDINGIPQLITAVIVQSLGQTVIKSAGIYAAGALLGVGFLPAGVLSVVVADDDASKEFNISLNKAVDICLEFIEETGHLKEYDRKKGVLHADIQGLSVKIKLEKLSSRKTKLTVSARKFMLPKAAEAAGILHQLSQRF